MIEQAQHTRIKIMFLFAIVALITLSLFSYVRINTLIDESKLINPTHQVKYELEKTLSYLNETESSQRGYMLTSDTVFLEPFYAANNKVYLHLKNVELLTKDNPTQQQNIIALKSAIDSKIAHLKRKVVLFQTSTISVDNRIKGKALMDDVRRQISKMHNEEDTVLSAHSTLYRKLALITPLLTILLILGSIIFLVISYFKIIKELNKSDRLKLKISNSELRLQTILENVPDAVITFNEDEIIRSWNPQAEGIFGWKEEEVLGKTLTETIIPERNRQHSKEIKHYLKTGEGLLVNKPIEVFALNKNNSEFPIELNISSCKINSDFVFIGFIRDITVRKQVEATLQNKAKQLEEAQQLAHIGSWEWNVPLNKIEWSDELFRIFGLMPQEFKADYENYLKYIHPDDRDYVNGIVQKAIKDQAPFNLIHKVVHPDGTIRVVSSSGKVITDSNGNTIRLAGTAQDVTKQKAYEAELKESEERFLKIFDYSPIPMIITEIKTNKIKYVNKKFYDAFGLAGEEVIGYTSEELNLVSPEENQRVVDLLIHYLQESRSLAELQALSAEETEELLVKLKQTDEMKDLVIYYTRKNGDTFPAIVSYDIIGFGTQRYTIASYQDISDRKKAEEQLAEQKAFAELIIENAPSMILVYDVNLNIIVWNKKSEEHTGLKKAEVLGKHTFDVFPEYNNEHWLSVINSVLKDGKSLHYPIIEFQHMKGFGESWVMPLLNIKQQIIGLLSITRIITETVEMTRALEQKNIELEKIIKELNQTAITLQESEERYHRMITEVKDYAILFLSADGTIENWNEGAEKIKGYKANEIIGKNFRLFYTEQERQEHVPEKLLAEAKQYETSHAEGWGVRKDGSLFWASTIITAVHDEKNNITGFSKVTRDLTDKKLASDKITEANKELEQKNAALQKANKELESFNYISSHDLQEPLRQIQNFASRIIDFEQQNLSDKGKIYFDKMNKAANRMQTLIADLLVYSRTTTAERKFEITDLNIIVNQVKSELKETINEKNATIVLDEMCEVNIIPFQFRQLMHNLIGNSLKFSKPNTPPLITIKSRIIKSDQSQTNGVNLTPEKGYCHISITDNGIGFEPQYKELIFELFQRLHDKQKIAGTGIGLAIVKKIVENHNGIITATSELDKGATFDIYIPASQTN